MRSKYLIGFFSFFFIWVLLGVLKVNYYKKSAYHLATMNGTSEILQDVVTQCLPEGVDPVGVLIAGQVKRYMDPRWPIPKKIIVEFKNGSGRPYEIFLETGLSSRFHGEITVVISENQTGYFLKLKIRNDS